MGDLLSPNSKAPGNPIQLLVALLSGLGRIWDKLSCVVLGLGPHPTTFPKPDYRNKHKRAAKMGRQRNDPNEGTGEIFEKDVPIMGDPLASSSRLLVAVSC